MMIETMNLRLRKGRDDPEDLEGVLSVLDRRLYDGGDGGVVFHTGLGPEASADLEFGLGRPEFLLAVVVRGRNGRVREEGEDVVPVLCDALFEFVQLGFLPVFPRVDGRSGEQLVQTFIHPCPHILPDVSLVPLVNGVPQEVKHVQAPCVIQEGLHGVGEVPQQVRDADLVVIHPDIPHEVGGPAVGHPDRPALSSRMASWRACSWSFSASSVESRSSEYPISRMSCLRLWVSLTRSASMPFLNPVLKSFSMPQK